MEFRPCIDIHNGHVKQIVGSSLSDAGNNALENYVADKPSTYYAKLFQSDKIVGAHVIMLNSRESEFYEATKKAAVDALRAYPNGLQIGGGITAENAMEFIAAGASHVIVTSFLFTDGKLDMSKLMQLKSAVGKEHIVIDLSCRQKNGKYYVVIDRWQTFTDTEVKPELFETLNDYCDEYLIHGVDVEGKKAGIDENLVRMLSKVNAVITYAGGISSIEDIDKICDYSEGKLNFTVGSALDIYGGILKYDTIK